MIDTIMTPINHPKSECTILKHYKTGYKGFTYHNDFGYPCDYRVCKDGIEIERVKYYRGRLLMTYSVE